MIEISPGTIARLVIAAGAAAGWLITGSVSQDTPDVRESQRSVARPSAAAMPTANFTEVLRKRMRQPVTPEAGRNPFAYGSRLAAPRRDTVAPMPAPETPAPAPVEPPLPVFKLSGIASSAQPDGSPVLTAIVIDNGTMVFVKSGDKLSNGYSVVRVDEMAITIVDAAGVTQTLRLP